MPGGGAAEGRGLEGLPTLEGLIIATKSTRHLILEV